METKRRGFVNSCSTPTQKICVTIFCSMFFLRVIKTVIKSLILVPQAHCCSEQMRKNGFHLGNGNKTLRFRKFFDSNRNISCLSTFLIKSISIDHCPLIYMIRLRNNFVRYRQKSDIAVIEKDFD